MSHQNKVIIPPLKTQGIKTKIVSRINNLVERSGLDLEHTRWIEPFFGSGVVGFNTIIGAERIVGDNNPHVIRFYQSIQNGELTIDRIKEFLETEGEKLKKDGYEHYKKIRNLFNENKDPLYYLFLTRSAFNGLTRFNKNGMWNVPFCKNPNRFSKAYISKICNQVMEVKNEMDKHPFTFQCCDFKDLILGAKGGDIIYCDPPYFGKSTVYFTDWGEFNEETLFNALFQTKAKFILSTWFNDGYKNNPMVDQFWKIFNMKPIEHFYQISGELKGRHSITEALFFNFKLSH